MLTYIYLVLFFNYFTKIDCDLNVNQQIRPQIEKPIHFCHRIVHPKVIKSPYKNKLKNIKSKPFSSVCLRCNLCLIMAKEVEQIFEETTQEYPKWQVGKIIEILEDRLIDLCTDDFVNNLSYNQQYYLNLSNMGGNSIIKLTEICFFYINNIDIAYLFENYLKEETFIENYLCKSDGIFRACNNLDYNRPEIDD